MSRDSKFRIESFNGHNFGLWKQKIEDYLYQKDNLYLALRGREKGQPDDMYDEYWELLDRKALGVIRLALADSVSFNVSTQTTTKGVMDALAKLYEKPSASNKELEAEKREDAVNSMVYEATARLRDPVYGCTGVVWQLQKKVSELQSQLETKQARLGELLKAQAKLTSTMTGFYGDIKEENSLFTSHMILQETDTDNDDLTALGDLVDPFSLLEPLWT